VALGVEGELPGFRLTHRRGGPVRGGPARGGPVGPGREESGGGISTRQPEFWGGEAGATLRAGRALSRVQQLLGPEAVVIGRLQGGRGPAERARVVPWSGRGTDPGAIGGIRRGRRPGPSGDPPWPGRVPPPAPMIVLAQPLPAQLVDVDGHLVGVSGGGMVTTTPDRLSVDGGRWTPVTGWAGPWPSDERWWSVPRRQARMQIVTGSGTAHLLTRERGGWWLEGTYD
jgi:protein ImuB